MDFDALSKFEISLVELLESLKTEQLRHVVVDDPNEPGVVPPIWRILLQPRRSFRRQFIAQYRYMRRRKIEPEFRPPMELAPLWERTKTPRKLRPTYSTPNDLEFDRFNLSFRIRPYKDSYYWYYVAYPNSDFHFRAIAHENSLRFFTTQALVMQDIEPNSLDFSPIQINSLAFDIKSRPRKRKPCIPTIMKLFLPKLSSNWDILNARNGIVETLAIDT